MSSFLLLLMSISFGLTGVTVFSVGIFVDKAASVPGAFILVLAGMMYAFSEAERYKQRCKRLQRFRHREADEILLLRML